MTSAGVAINTACYCLYNQSFSNLRASNPIAKSDRVLNSRFLSFLTNDFRKSPNALEVWHII